MRFLLIIVLLSISFSASAQQSAYEKKVHKIETSLLSKKEIARWQNDILYPHLYEQWLTKNIENISTEDANAFMATADYRAAAWFFKPKWDKELIRRKDWASINKQFIDETDPDLICWYLASQQALKQPLNQIKIEKLWNSGDSRPDHCDPFLIEWIEANKNADALVWERQLKAFYARNGKLLRYLNRFYREESAKQLGLFLNTVYNDPKQIVSKSYDPESIAMHELALAAVNRMAFQDPRSASNLWLQVVKATPSLSPDEVRAASRYLGIAMAKLALPEASYWLTIADPTKSDETIQHWRLQIALSQKSYDSVISLYSELSPSLKKTNQWLYWYGLAKLKTEGFVSNDNPLNELSRKRLYYGYLAAGALGLEPSLQSSPDYPPLVQLNLKNLVGLQRAKKLFESGDTLRAQVEWNMTVRPLNDAAQNAAAELALSWGWYAKASQAAGWSGRYDLIHLRYPSAFADAINKQSALHDLPTYWLYGIMRQESRYEHTAISPVGAKGLMQIMPATARQTAKKHKLPYASTDDLFDPETNIAIGSSYLSDLLRKYEHPVFATAAYNAGPSRVNVWRERFPNEITIWIESIPFDETRNYVKSVLAYSQIYAITSEANWHLASWTNPAGSTANLQK